MKQSIRKLVAGSLVCVMMVGSAPFFNVSTAEQLQVHASSNRIKQPLEEVVYGTKRHVGSTLCLCMGASTVIKISLLGGGDVTYTCESSNPSIFTVDDEGLLTPKSVGKATLKIVASFENGETETHEQRVEVMKHFVCGDMAYAPLDDGTNIFLQASYCSRNITKICLPHSICGVETSVIGKESCAGYKKVTFIEVPNCVTTIEERAFAEDDALKFVMIPKSVTKIADNIFGEGAKEDKIILKGYKGSAAEDFAKDHKDQVTFEAIEGSYTAYRTVDSIEFTGIQDNKVMEVGEEYDFKVKTSPEVVDEEVTFSSKDESVVSITKEGSAVAKKEGQTVIVATSETGIKKEIKVIVGEGSTTTSTETPTAKPTATPTAKPTGTPTAKPTATPTATPTGTPTAKPTATPTAAPTGTPTAKPTATPTAKPTGIPTATPTAKTTTTSEEKTTTTSEKKSVTPPIEDISTEFKNDRKEEQVTTTPNSVTTQDTKEKKASLKITTKAGKKFAVGKKYTLKAKKSNTAKKLKWSVSNKKIATINEKTGVLKAKKAGKVTVMVTCGSLKKKITINIA